MARIGFPRRAPVARPRAKAAGDSFTLDLAGFDVPLRVVRNRRARRIVLSIDPERAGAVVTLPRGVPAKEGIALAREQAGWIIGRLKELPPRVAFADGAVVPLLGEDHVVRHRPESRRGVWREGPVINVSGRAEHLARRLEDWLTALARREVSARAHALASELGKRPLRIALRDTRSLWGSCSPEGRLSFSWRLVMAPAAVLDYVVAHEIAHLEVKNHGRRFWALVERLSPGFASARAWLRCNGARLHRYG